MFFFNDTATTEIYTLSLHDALPIFVAPRANAGDVGPDQLEVLRQRQVQRLLRRLLRDGAQALRVVRSEEHTSELQSRQYLVCRLLLEKKKHNLSLTLFLRRIRHTSG